MLTDFKTKQELTEIASLKQRYRNEKIKEFLSERSLKEYQNEGILKSTDTYTMNSTEFTLPPINNYTPKGFGKRTPQPMFSFNI